MVAPFAQKITSISFEVFDEVAPSYRHSYLDGYLFQQGPPDRYFFLLLPVSLNHFLHSVLKHLTALF